VELPRPTTTHRSRKSFCPLSTERRACGIASTMIKREHTGRQGRRMDYANDNAPPEVARNLRNYTILGLALLVSGTLWFVMGLWVWRVLTAWLHGL
jgi:hypothetical protein